MRRITDFVPRELPEDVRKMLADPLTLKSVRMAEIFSDPQEEEERRVRRFAFPSLCSPDGKRILLALEEEHTDAGVMLLETLWFGRWTEICLEQGGVCLRAPAFVFRCHIAGPLFADMLLQFRKASPDADIASAWELHAGDWFSEAEPEGGLEPVEHPARGHFPEFHLDNPRICIP